MEGAEHTGPDDDSERDGAAPSRFSSETVTRKGMKQDTEPEPPSMVADFNHLLAEKREAVTCLPNLYRKTLLTIYRIRSYVKTVVEISEECPKNRQVILSWVLS